MMKDETARQNTNCEKKDAYKILAKKHEVKSPFGRPKRRWEDNIKIGEIGCDDADETNVAKDWVK
jgi:hypothetical protein